MRTIWKFPLQPTDYQAIEMPIGAKLLQVHAQDGQPCVWTLVDPDAETESRRFVMVGTGHPLPDAVENDLRYVGTAHLSPYLVFHVFEQWP